MLTRSQIQSLPKGEFSNIQLSSVYPSQGKQSRQSSIPVDRFGRFTQNLKKAVGFKLVRLNRSMAKRFNP